MRPFCLAITATAMLLPGLCFAQDILPAELPMVGIHASACPVCPQAGERMRVTSSETTVYVQPGVVIDLAPTFTRPGVNPMTAFLFLDHIQIARVVLDGSRRLPVFSVPMPVHGPHFHRASVTVQDENNQAVETQRCDLITRDAETLPRFAAGWLGESIKLTVDNRAALGDVWVYLNGTCLGKMDAAEAVLDARRLSPGTYHFSLAATDKEGAFLPLQAADMVIAPRFDLSTDAGGARIVVPVGAEKPVLNITVARHDSVNAKQMFTFVADHFGGAIASQKGALTIDLHDVPTGTATIEVVAAGADGTLYAPQSMQVQVVNLDWQDRLEHTADYQDAMGIRSDIAELQQKAIYWYTKAVTEPDFLASASSTTVETTDSFGRDITTTYINTLITPGKAGEYMANCRTVITQIAQMQMRLADSYHKINMRESARATYRSIVHEAGEESPLSGAAKAQLAMMNQERNHSLPDLVKQ